MFVILHMVSFEVQPGDRPQCRLNRKSSHTINDCIRVLTTKGFLGGWVVKILFPVQETWIRPLGWEDPLEKEMKTRSSTLAWKSH